MASGLSSKQNEQKTRTIYQYRKLERYINTAFIIKRRKGDRPCKYEMKKDTVNMRKEMVGEAR